MDKLKQYVALTVLGSLVVLALGWFFVVSPKRSQASDLDSQTATKSSENSQLKAALQVLKAQAKDLPKQQAKLAAVAARIPDNPALPALIRALTTASKSAGVELVSVTPGVPAAGTGVAAGGAVTAPAAAGTTAAVPTGTAGQLQTIPLALNVVGGYFQVEQFVAALENLPRSMRVSNLQLTPGPNPVKPTTGAPVDDGRSLVTTISGSVFMASNRPPATAVSVPGAAVAGTAAAPAAPVARPSSPAN
jgi:Tfp pilus assembly protein PilO